MDAVSIDFETRSTVDLRKTGVYPYAEHRHTGIWCMAWALNDDEPEIWRPEEPFPEELADLILDGVELRAWNAQFERVMWRSKMRQYGAPIPKLEQWVDTAAEAAAMSLPRSLDECARVTGIVQQKDTSGYQLMLRMARPRNMVDGEPIWWDLPDRRHRLEEYCKQDVRVERSLSKILRRLSDEEREIYLLDQRINDRGVYLDAELAQASLEIVEEGLSRASETIAEITKGRVSAVTNTGELRTWLTEKTKREVESISKAATRDLLESDLSTEVRDVLELRAEAGRTSTAKIKAMLNALCDDNKIRGMLMYYGANTGRWAGRLVQPQNMPRGTVANAEQYIPLILENRYDELDLHCPPLEVVSSLLRPMFRATPGNILVAGDYSQIEARVLAWLAGETELIATFAGDGKVYERMAAAIYRTTPDAIAKGSDERQLGKATILGCGFGMGHEKFMHTAKAQYGLTISKSDAERAVGTYRAQNGKIVDYWYHVNAAAMDAVRKPGSVHRVGDCAFTARAGYLILKLPSGRFLHYARPQIGERETPWGEMREAVVVQTVNSYTRQWGERSLYGGLITENIVQATARDIMASAMLRLDTHGYPVILTVHDEIVTERPASRGPELDRFIELMTTLPDWAKGLPVAAEAWTGERYQK